MHELIVVITPREYSLSESQLDNVALEFMGTRVNLIGGIDDVHYLFEKKSHFSQFKKAIEQYRLE